MCVPLPFAAFHCRSLWVSLPFRSGGKDKGGKDKGGSRSAGAELLLQVSCLCPCALAASAQLAAQNTIMMTVHQHPHPHHHHAGHSGIECAFRSRARGAAGVAAGEGDPAGPPGVRAHRRFRAGPVEVNLRAHLGGLQLEGAGKAGVRSRCLRAGLLVEVTEIGTFGTAPAISLLRDFSAPRFLSPPPRVLLPPLIPPLATHRSARACCNSARVRSRSRDVSPSLGRVGDVSPWIGLDR